MNLILSKLKTCALQKTCKEDEKTSYILGENICKTQLSQRIHIYNIERTLKLNIKKQTQVESGQKT